MPSLEVLDLDVSESVLESAPLFLLLSPPLLLVSEPLSSLPPLSGVGVGSGVGSGVGVGVTFLEYTMVIVCDSLV